MAEKTTCDGLYLHYLKIYNVFLLQMLKGLNHKFTIHETTILHHSLQVPGSLRKIPPEGAGRAHRKIRPGWGVGP